MLINREFFQHKCQVYQPAVTLALTVVKGLIINDITLFTATITIKQI